MYDLVKDASQKSRNLPLPLAQPQRIAFGNLFADWQGFELVRSLGSGS
jgi:hypothetical protein